MAKESTDPKNFEEQEIHPIAVLYLDNLGKQE